ncbi:MAG: WG repeat-containing protein [Planctomycetota bacterium]
MKKRNPGVRVNSGWLGVIAVWVATIGAMPSVGQISADTESLRIRPSPEPGDTPPTLDLNNTVGERVELVDPSFDDELFPFSTRGVWGMANRRGEVVVYPEWDWADFVYDGVHRVVLDGWTYLLRTSGSSFTVYRNEPIEDDFKAQGFGYADRFSEGVIVVSTADRFRLIDKAGRWLGGAEAELILRMSDGMAAAWSDGRAGYLDRAGKWRIERRFPVGSRVEVVVACVV